MAPLAIIWKSKPSPAGFALPFLVPGVRSGGSVLVGSVAAGPEYRTPVGTRWEVPFFMPMAAMQYAATSEAKGHAGATTEVAAWPRLVSETCRDQSGSKVVHKRRFMVQAHAPRAMRALSRAFCFRSVWFLPFLPFRSFRSVRSVPARRARFRRTDQAWAQPLP